MNDKLYELIKIVLTDSSFGIGLRNRIAEHYLLPKPGLNIAPIQNLKISRPGGVDRPDKESVDIENNPKLKAEYEDTERLMGAEDDDEED